MLLDKVIITLFDGLDARRISIILRYFERITNLGIPISFVLGFLPVLITGFLGKVSIVFLVLIILVVVLLPLFRKKLITHRNYILHRLKDGQVSGSISEQELTSAKSTLNNLTVAGGK